MGAMRTRKTLARSLLPGGIGLLAGMMALAAPAWAAPELIEEFVREDTLERCVPPTATDLRPFFGYVVNTVPLRIGHVPFPIVGTGGTTDLDPTNSPHFGAVATLATNGINDVVVMGFDILNAGALDVTPEVAGPESSFFNNGFSSRLPDVAGDVAFVRLIVEGIDQGPAPCGSFVYLKTRWQFWGTPAPSLRVVATGCSPCVNGQIASFVARVNNFGAPFEAELDASAVFPDSSRVSLFGPSHVVTVPAGESDLPLVSIAVSDQAPPGLYLLEAALTDLTRGVTRARGVVPARKQ